MIDSDPVVALGKAFVDHHVAGVVFLLRVDVCSRLAGALERRCHDGGEGHCGEPARQGRRLLLAYLVQGDPRAPAGEDPSLVGRGSTMANKSNGGHHVSL